MLYIFDWDGTLMNSVGRIVSCLRSAADELSLDVLPDNQYQNIIGLGLPEAVATLYPHIDVTLQTKMRDAYSRHFKAADTRPSDFFPGVLETLSMLRDDGHQLAVATGKSRAGLNRVLSKLDWLDYFDATRCADETASKPNPMMLHEILSELNCSVEDAVMVGDTEFDLVMAHNAGMKKIAVSFGAHSQERLMALAPDAMLHNFSELQHF